MYIVVKVVSCFFRVDGDPKEEILQDISFRSPWPCCYLEVNFTGQSGLFIAVLDVAVFGESLPSGLSTPIKLSNRK